MSRREGEDQTIQARATPQQMSKRCRPSLVTWATWATWAARLTKGTSDTRGRMREEQRWNVSHATPWQELC